MCQGYILRDTPQAATLLMEACGDPEESLAELDLPCTSNYGAAAMSGDVVARLMMVHSLASTTADAVLLGQPLPPQEQAALLQLWPTLLKLTAAAAHSTAGATPSTPFAAAANLILAQRGEAPQQPAVCLAFPQPEAPQPHSAFRPEPPCATALHFELAAPPADAAAHAELQVFAQQVNRGIEQSSKEALEDTLSELRASLPFASAVSIVRRSIEGTLEPGMLPLRHSLRNKLLQRSSSVSMSEESATGASTPLRISLSLPRHSDSSSLRTSLGLPPQ
jgi:hypothetical protein